MESPSALALRASALARPAGIALRRPANWIQLVKFSLVGSSGYAVNLAIFASLVTLAGVHFLLAATAAFLVAVANNYTWNRLWTFRDRRGNVVFQGLRFLAVSVAGLCANLGLLSLFVTFGVGELGSQATAIVLVTPISFLGNKLWSFRV